MPGLYHIVFLPSGHIKQFAGSQGNYYELENGTQLDMPTVPVWCHHCGGFTHGESLSSIEEIDREIADLHDPNSEPYRMWTKGVTPGNRLLVKRIEELHLQRQLRERRSSSPKCIHCGSANIVNFPIGKEAPNPGGPGTVKIIIAGMCSTNFNEWFFTPEGERIPRDTKPTYWHHPALDYPPKSKIGWLKKLLRR